MHKKVLVTGGTGLIGSAVKLLCPEAITFHSAKYDLRNKSDTISMYECYRPTHVIHLAGKVGGIKANTDYPADFFWDNIQISSNVLHFAHLYKVEKVVSVLSTCIYPDIVTYPIFPDELHHGNPHSSNFAYAHAKRMIDVQSRAYRKQYGCNFVTLIPNNNYGPTNDNYDLNDSHVIPAIIRKVYEAKLNGDSHITFWGDGKAERQFTLSIDTAKILLWALDNFDNEHPFNIGDKTEYSVAEVIDTICHHFEYSGQIRWNGQLGGQLRKPAYINMAEFGYTEPTVELFDGLKVTCDWFKDNYPYVRGINKKHRIFMATKPWIPNGESKIEGLQQIPLDLIHVYEAGKD